MRLGDQIEIIKTNTPRLKLEHQQINGQPLVRVTNASQVKAALDALGTLPYLASVVEGVRSSPLYNVMDGTNVDLALVTQYNGSLQGVTHQANQMVNALALAAPKEHANGLLIQLPVVEDLKDLQDVIGDIQLAIDQPTRIAFGEKVKVAGFESGSTFLQVLAEHTPVITFIGTIITTYLDIRLRQLQVREQIKKLEAMGVEKAEIEPVNTRLQASVRLAYDKAADQIVQRATELVETKDEKKRIQENAPEIKQTALIGLEKLDKLWEQGTIFQPTLTAAPEIRKLLPRPVGKIPSDAKLLASASTVDAGKAKS